MKLEEKTTEKEYVYRGRIINVTRDKVTLPNGSAGIREVVELPSPSRSFPCCRITRSSWCASSYAYREELLKSGRKMNPGEKDPFRRARELKEETGYEAKRMDYLGCIYQSPGILDEVRTCFCRDLDRRGEIPTRRIYRVLPSRLR
jgi:ADP-ribose pyrophosphatase